MKEGDFYKAWCGLEQCEITIASLKRHFSSPPDDPHRLVYIEKMVERWQSLFPYSVFFSPEFVKKCVECSTCGARVSLRNPCGHEKGQIYDGQQCCHRVIEAEMLAIAAVANPVQKYSVPFMSSKDGSGQLDHYDYRLVKFAADRLASPYHGWHDEKQTRTFPISAMAGRLPDTPCPCVSGMEFGKCCSTKPEIVVPHYQFVFHFPPPPGLPMNELNV
jgi:hypothetical protein